MMPQTQKTDVYLHQILAAITEIKGDIQSFITCITSDIRPFLNKQLECNTESKNLLEEVKTKIETFSTNVNSLVNYNLVNEHYQKNVEEQAYKKRQSIKQTWFQKRNHRKQLCFNILRDEGTTKMYKQWLTTKEFLPRKHQPKKIPGEPQEQYQIRQQLGYAKMKSEIDIMTNRAEKNARKIREVDAQMKAILEKIATGSTLNKLQEIWETEIKKGEEISKRGWQKKEEWLKALPNRANQPRPQQRRQARSYADVARYGNNQRPFTQNQSWRNGQTGSYSHNHPWPTYLHNVQGPQQSRNQPPHGNTNFPPRNQPHHGNNNFQRGRPTMRQNTGQQRESVFRRLGNINPATYHHSGPSTHMSFQQRRNFQTTYPSQQRHRINNYHGGFLGLGEQFHPHQR